MLELLIINVSVQARESVRRVFLFAYLFKPQLPKLHQENIHILVISAPSCLEPLMHAVH